MKRKSMGIGIIRSKLVGFGLLMSCELPDNKKLYSNSCGYRWLSNLKYLSYNDTLPVFVILLCPRRVQDDGLQRIFYRDVDSNIIAGRRYFYFFDIGTEIYLQTLRQTT